MKFFKKSSPEPVIALPQETALIELPSADDSDREWVKSFKSDEIYYFLQSCESGKLWRMQYALQTNKDLKRNMDTALEKLCASGPAKAIYLLHLNGANLDDPKGRFLRFSCAAKNKAVTQLLLKLRCNPETAKENMDSELDKFFLDKCIATLKDLTLGDLLSGHNSSKASKDFEDAIYKKASAAYKVQTPAGGPEIPAPTEEDIKWADGLNTEGLNSYGSPIESICQHGQLWRMQYAIEKGYNIKSDQRAALSEAAKYNQTDLILLLYANGIDLNRNNGRAIKLAAQCNKADSIKLLIRLGADLKLAYEHADTEQQRIFMQSLINADNPIWIKNGDHSVSRIEFQKHLSPKSAKCLTTTFNFNARTITTVVEKGENISQPVIQTFTEQETTKEIEDAHIELIKNGGSPGPLNLYTKKSGKTPAKPAPVRKQEA